MQDQQENPINEKMKEGFDAFIEGIDLDKNPYVFNTTEWRRWNRGWGNARMGQVIQEKQS